MARHKYRPYRYSSYTRKIRNRRYMALSFVIIIIVAVFLIKSRGKNEQAALPLGDDILISENKITEETTTAPVYQSETVKETLPDIVSRERETPISPPIEELTVYSPEEEQVNPEIAALISEANSDMASGKVIAARDKFNQLLTIQLTSTQFSDVKNKLSLLSKKWLFSKDHYPEDPLTASYKVQPGDRLVDIGKKHKVPYEILMSINGIEKPELLRSGKTIKVINGPFNAIVYSSSFTLDLYLGNNTYVKTYSIGLGESSKETPTGRWRLKNDGKLIEPPWPSPEGKLVYSGDPEYPLGSRWIGLVGIQGNAMGRTGFGIHGTKDPKTIETRSSQGCIRLYNGDVIELYNMLTSGLSEIRVVE